MRLLKGYAAASSGVFSGKDGKKKGMTSQQLLNSIIDKLKGTKSAEGLFGRGTGYLWNGEGLAKFMHDHGADENTVLFFELLRDLGPAENRELDRKATRRSAINSSNYQHRLMRRVLPALAKRLADKAADRDEKLYMDRLWRGDAEEALRKHSSELESITDRDVLRALIEKVITIPEAKKLMEIDQDYDVSKSGSPQKTKKYKFQFREGDDTWVGNMDIADTGVVDYWLELEGNVLGGSVNHTTAFIVTKDKSGRQVTKDNPGYLDDVRQGMRKYIETLIDKAAPLLAWRSSKSSKYY